MFLPSRADPKLDVSEIPSRESLELAQVERLVSALAIIHVAGTIPRRLAEATPEELALDKKRARRVSHALAQSLAGWTKKWDLPDSGQIRQDGAQLNWETWAERHLTDIHEQIRLVATFGVFRDEERWGKSAVVKLENELRWVEYSLRD